MGILSDADVLNAVIDADSNGVATPKIHIASNIITMRDGKRHLVANLLTIDIYRGLNMRTLEKECDTLVLHRFRDIYRPAIPRFARIVTLRSQEEGKLHLSYLAVLLHIGVEVIGRVIQRPRPLRFRCHNITLAISEHRAWEHDIIVVGETVSHGKIPGSRQRNILRLQLQTAEKGKDTDYSSHDTDILMSSSPAVLSASRGR